MKKRLFALALAGVLAAATLTGCGSLKGDETVATVDVTKIDADLANFFARYTQATYETYYSAYLGEDMWNSDASDGETYEESVKSSVLKSLEDMILLEKHMEDYDVSITDEDKAMIKETTQQFLNDNSLDDKNLVSGNEKTVNRALTLMAVQQKMRTAIQAGADTEVSDEEAAQKTITYVRASTNGTADENGDTVDLTEEELAAKKETLNQIRDEAGSDGDLDAAAKNHDLSAVTTSYGADDENLNEDVKAAAETLSDGEYADIIEGDNAYYLVRMDSTFDREATDSHKQVILSQREKDAYTAWVDSLKEGATITTNDKALEKLTFERVFTQKTADTTDAAEETDENADTTDGSADGAESEEAEENAQ